MDQAADRAGSLVAGYAHLLLADLLRSGDVPRAEARRTAPMPPRPISPWTS
jgi:hypothetical protein